MCTFAEMTILSGQSRLFHEYSKHLLLATAPLQENQDVLPLKNFDGLELVSYNNNERNNGVSSLYVDCTKTNVVGDYYNARELRIPFSVPYSGNANNLHTTEAHPDDDLTRPSPRACASGPGVLGYAQLGVHPGCGCNTQVLGVPRCTPSRAYPGTPGPLAP